jgi:6-pyruvoyltetrahydropterin/6-carboxytetrahydropterin synthase
MEDIGYAIDFKEIKRIGCQWIEDYLDHGMILNPEDKNVILACEATKSKTWFMSLNGAESYCNPSVENIVKEMFLAVGYLLNTDHLILKKIRLYETPNCYSDCHASSITELEKFNFMQQHKTDLDNYKSKLGTIEYDDRKI